MSCILDNGSRASAIESVKRIADETGSMLPQILLIFCVQCNKQHPIENEDYIGGSRSGYSSGSKEPLQFKKENKQDHTPKKQGMNLQEYFEQE